MRFALLALALTACASASNGTTDSNGSPGDGGVVDSVPDANTCAVQPCSILPQCGCAADSACDIDTSDLMGGACRAITSPGVSSNTCNGPKDCDRGYVCLGPTGSASCHKYCSQDTDCGTSRGQCVIDIASGGNVIPGVPPACSSECDPTSTNPLECPPTHTCSLFTTTHNGAQIKISDCSKAGTGVQTTSCKVGTAGDDSLCGKGYLCTTLDGGSNFNCRRICQVTASNCGARTCKTFTTPYTIKGVEYGVCSNNTVTD
jgi:hypothetical protein